MGHPPVLRGVGSGRPAAVYSAGLSVDISVAWICVISPDMIRTAGRQVPGPGGITPCLLLSRKCSWASSCIGVLGFLTSRRAVELVGRRTSPAGCLGWESQSMALATGADLQLHDISRCPAAAQPSCATEPQYGQVRSLVLTRTVRLLGKSAGTARAFVAGLLHPDARERAAEQPCHHHLAFDRAI